MQAQAFVDLMHGTVIVNDTDLVEPIRIVTQELKKNVLILSTSKFGASPPLQKGATSVLHT
jgi:hypothetical protein